MKKLGNIVGNVDDLRREREARLNPPEYEIGQGDDSDWDFFGEDGGDFGMEDSAFGGDDFGSFGGGDDFGSFGGGTQGSFSNTVQGGVTSTEDKVFDAVVKVGKGTGKGAKELVNSIYDGAKGNNAFYWTVYGKRVLFCGIWISVIGVILTFMEFVTNISNGFYVMIGGLITLAIGVLIFCLNCEKANEEGNIKKEVKQKVVLDDSFDSSNEEEDIWSDDSDYEEESNWGMDFDGSESSSDDFDPWDSLGDDFEDTTSINTEPEVNVDIDEAISNIREIPAHTQTRQYLFEEYNRVLPLINPEFAKLKSISENSDEFIIFDKILRDASLQSGCNEEKLPELLELRENQFIIQLKATRPSGLKEEAVANEIANMYSRDEYGTVTQEGVYANSFSVGSNYIVNIFKGENSLVTLADTYREVKDFVLDTKVKKPIVMGVNELGKVWTFDAEKVFSYIISGKPRSGKSWSVVSLVLQLCMYSSPREVNFEVFDVKGATSDYYSMKDYLPHFNRFESSGRSILQRLKYLTTTEAARREKILKANNVISIADLKSKGVDIEIPYLYVLIDEIVGLMDTFDKDEKAEFKGLVNRLITQMPNLGIRLILIPHRVTNDIVPKTTYTNVGCIACVKSDFKEIVNTLDITKKDFPYDLSNTGDMALKTSEVNKGKAVFCHGVAVTDSNERNVDIYKFIGSLWGILEPNNKEKDNSNMGVSMEDLFTDASYEDSDVDESFWKDYLGD